MVVDFSYCLERGLDRILFIEKLEFILSSLDSYTDAKRFIVDSIADLYGDRLVEDGLRRPDLYNWLFERFDDEVSYFVVEAGANVIHHARLRDAMVRVYFGQKGFIVEFEQANDFFNAELVVSQRIMTHKGGGFLFFNGCRGIVFFDNSTLVRCVYYAYFFE